ncbi:MAG: hypothetical protein CMJ49_01830 [Planctomycetaceae bacterium]|nr:hypothetical protein [Planctomycetaceae bacterium]
MQLRFGEREFELGGKYLGDDLRESYDLTEGHFTNDPAELVDRSGGRWDTTNFQAGDAIIFNRYLLHAGPTNRTHRFRFGVDTRYQPASHPVDDRSIGKRPKMHTGFWAPVSSLNPLTIHVRDGMCEYPVPNAPVAIDRTAKPPIRPVNYD